MNKLTFNTLIGTKMRMGNLFCTSKAAENVEKQI